MFFARLRLTLAEVGAEIEDWHDHTAEIEHAAHGKRRVQQFGRLGPAPDFPDLGDLDAVETILDDKGYVLAPDLIGWLLSGVLSGARMVLSDCTASIID